MFFYGQVFEFCDAQKFHECTVMPFSVVEWINIDVFGSYQVMSDGFYTFERLEYQISLSYKRPHIP
jgi:hypothetical protein